MNMQSFFNSLSVAEKVELDDLIYVWKKQNATEVANSIILNEMEIADVQNNLKIEAIKSIKDRCGCSLLAAKIAVDNFEEKIRLIGLKK